MNWATGLSRLSVLVVVGCLTAIPLEAGSSLVEMTRGQVAAVHNQYAWDNANLSEGRLAAQPDGVVSQMGRAELMVGAATVAMLICLGLLGWVVAGFRRE